MDGQARTDEALLRLELPARAEAAGAARKALTSLNGSLHLISQARLRDAQLLVSELVANAVRHGGQTGAPIELRVQTTPATVRVQVSDHGDGFDPQRPAEPSPERAGGWGLRIVGALAHRWGLEGGGGPGTSVWFEIDRPQRETPVRVHSPTVGHTAH